MKRSAENTAGLMVFCLLLLAVAASGARADVEPGDVIDKTNHQKIEGLVPEFIQEWVKNGDLTMKIGKLTYDPGDMWSVEVKENWEANKRRYKIDHSNGIIDVEAGKPARGIKGLPFPEPDESDPALPQMLVWNRQFNEYFLQGPMREVQVWISITRRGPEKTLIMDNLTSPLDPAKNDLDFAHLTVFREPFSMAGIGTLVVYPLYPLNDGTRYAYTPELRRLKRMSHRLAGSDVHFGLDNAPDDSWAGGPKTSMEDGVYRYLGERDALVAYASESPRIVPRNAKGEIDIGYENTGMAARLGYEDPEWKGAAWHPVNIVWVKSRVWVIESRSKSASYPYGPCEGWIEKRSFFNCYKQTTDPSGKLWKGVYWPGQAMQTEDGKFRLTTNLGWYEVDMRRDHGSAMVGSYWKGAYRRIFVSDMDPSLFTQAGFVKFAR